jgi:hypothetical protein
VAELVTHPQIAVVRPLHRLGIDVPAGQEPSRRGRVDDGEADDAVRIPELDEVFHCDRAGTALCRLEVRFDVVRADEEVAGVGLCAEAVVGHREELTRRTSTQH